MFSKIIITILALAISVVSFGAAEVVKSETMGQEALKYVKEKFEFAYHGEYYFVHDADNKLKDFRHMQMPILTYKPLVNWKLTALAEFKYADSEAGVALGYPNRFFRSLYNLTRENVLVEKDNGVKMDLGIGRRVYDRKTFANTFGNSRLFANFAKALPGGMGKNTSTLLVQYFYNDPKNVTATSFRHGLELLPTISLQLSPKFTFGFQDDINFQNSWLSNNPRSIAVTHEAYSTLTYNHNDFVSPFFQFKYVHDDSFAAPKKPGTPVTSDTISYALGAGLTLTKKITLTVEATSDIFASSDNYTLADKFKYIDFDMALDITF
jgi:hypothetical protein